MNRLERMDPLKFFAGAFAILAIFSIIGAYGWRWMDCLDGYESQYITVPVVQENGKVVYLAVEDGEQRCR